MLQQGQRPHRRIPYDQDFYLNTLPTTRWGTARIQPNRGIKIHYLNYWADAFRDPAVQGTSVPARYDPFDAATAYAFVGGRWARCISEHYHHFRGRTEREITLASVELRARQQQHAAQRTVTAARLAAFLTSVEAEDGDSIGRDTFFANSASFDLIDLDGNTHDVDSALYSLDGYFRGGTFYPGTRSSGQMVFRIPEGSAPARLILGSGARVELDLRVAPSR